MFKSLARIVALSVLIGTPLAVCMQLATETYREVRRIGMYTYTNMDMQVRTFHYVVGHKEKVQGCRECYRELHEYLKSLEQEHPQWFLE